MDIFARFWSLRKHYVLCCERTATGRPTPFCWFDQKSVSIYTPEQSQATASAVAPLIMNSCGDRNCVLAGMSVVISCSNTAPNTSFTTRTQTVLPFGGAAMNSVRIPPVAMAKLAPMSVSVGAPVPSFATSCQRVWVPHWKPMPMPMPMPLMAVAYEINSLPCA